MPEKILFICHVEPMFEDSGLFTEEYLYDLAEVIESGEFTTILLDSEIEGNYPWLHKIVDEVWGWSWGYEKDVGYDFDCDDPNEWLISALGHEWTWIPPEIRNGRFKNAEVYICGGADGECLSDWESVLEHLDIPYFRKSELIY
jgi:hypothetical protein